MAPLRYTAKFDPFLFLDCAPCAQPWRNPKKGRDPILPSGNLALTVYLCHVVDELVAEPALVVAQPAEEAAQAVLPPVVVGDDPARVAPQPLLADVALDHVRLALHLGVRLLVLAPSSKNQFINFLEFYLITLSIFTSGR